VHESSEPLFKLWDQLGRAADGCYEREVCRLHHMRDVACVVAQASDAQRRRFCEMFAYDRLDGSDRLFHGACTGQIFELS
jgi:hypothetical protein